MTPRQLLDILRVAERLKDTTRHCYTSGGRHESVAEHSWRMTLMAFFIRDEFPEADMDKVMRMCLIHDLGEAFTGDIPTFDKTAQDEKTEEDLLSSWVASLPEPYAGEMRALYAEMNARETLEAKIYKALDNLEAVIQHNEADLSTWIEREYSLNLTYGNCMNPDEAASTELCQHLVRIEGEPVAHARGISAAPSTRRMRRTKWRRSRRVVGRRSLRASTLAHAATLRDTVCSAAFVKCLMGGICHSSPTRTSCFDLKRTGSIFVGSSWLASSTIRTSKLSNAGLPNSTLTVAGDTSIHFLSLSIDSP